MCPGFLGGGPGDGASLCAFNTNMSNSRSRSLAASDRVLSAALDLMSLSTGDVERLEEYLDVSSAICTAGFWLRWALDIFNVEGTGGKGFCLRYCFCFRATFGEIVTDSASTGEGLFTLELSIFFESALDRLLEDSPAFVSDDEFCSRASDRRLEWDDAELQDWNRDSQISGGEDEADVERSAKSLMSGLVSRKNSSIPKTGPIFGISNESGGDGSEEEYDDAETLLLVAKRPGLDSGSYSFLLGRSEQWRANGSVGVFCERVCISSLALL